MQLEPILPNGHQHYMYIYYSKWFKLNPDPHIGLCCICRFRIQCLRRYCYVQKNTLFPPRYIDGLYHILSPVCVYSSISAVGLHCYMMTSSNGYIFRVTGHLCGEFTGPGELPAQRPVTRSFDVFFDLRPNKWLSKQWWSWWFETPSSSLWRHCNDVRITDSQLSALMIHRCIWEGPCVMFYHGTCLYRMHHKTYPWFYVFYFVVVKSSVRLFLYSIRLAILCWIASLASVILRIIWVISVRPLLD